MSVKRRPFPVLALPTHFTGERLRVLALKYQYLRLHALRTDPDAYAANYDTEAQVPIEEWERRLTNDYARIFIVLDSVDTIEWPYNDETRVPIGIEDVEWIGSLVLFGPKPLSIENGTAVQEEIAAATSPYGHFLELIKPPPPDPISPASSENSTHPLTMYFMKDVYIKPSFRGEGLGKKLLTTALNVARHEKISIEPSGGRNCTIMVDKSNSSATASYLKIGFQVVVEEPYSRRDGRGDVALCLSQDLPPSDRSFPSIGEPSYRT